MNLPLSFLFLYHFFLCGKTQTFRCPQYELLNKGNEDQESSIDKFAFKCDFSVTSPKKVINPYKNELQNYVQSKPFGSICLRCSMCLAIAKEMDQVFKEISDSYRNSKQTEVITVLNEKLNSLCFYGFENHDLRKFKQYQVVSDEFKCSSHVRSKMDGKWTEKLREICSMYSHHIDVQYLLNNYFNGTDDLPNYLCRNNGIFRDCSSLNFKNTSIPDEEVHFLKCD